MGKKLIYLFNLFLSHMQKYFCEIILKTSLHTYTVPRQTSHHV